MLGPSAILTFLGIVIDTNRYELRIPEEKLSFMREQVQLWLGRRSGKYKELESLLGHLAHTATVIRDGRTFLRHLFSLLSVTRSRYHYVHLDGAARADPFWRACFLQHWNGRSFLPQLSLPTTHVYTDASGKTGILPLLLKFTTSIQK